MLPSDPSDDSLSSPTPKIAVIYIIAGNGHITPAKAIAQACQKVGYDVELFNFFDIIHAPIGDRFNRHFWRFELRFHSFERSFNAFLDKGDFAANRIPGTVAKRKMHFKRWIEKTKPDCIITTVYFASLAIPEFLRSVNRSDIPVFAYNPDIFFSLRCSINPHLAKHFSSTQEGLEDSIIKGQPENTADLCAFPIRSNFLTHECLSMTEARNRLGLAPDTFTILLNMGGEAIGTSRLLREITRLHLPLQVIVLGKISKYSQKKSKQIDEKSHGQLKILAPGYVDDVMTYLQATDIVVGKPGANAIGEALFARKPFLMTYLMNNSEYQIAYLRKHGVGWYAKGSKNQAAIIKHCIEHPEALEEIQNNFDTLPLKFGASDLMEAIQKIQNWN